MELMRRIIRDVLPKADVEVTVSLTVLTNAPLPNPEANLRAAVVASTVVINNRTILTDGADGYIIWTETAASSACKYNHVHKKDSSSRRQARGDTYAVHYALAAKISPFFDEVDPSNSN
jgi:hypothetical protein